MRHWLCDPGEQPQGPFTIEQVRSELASGRYTPRVMACPEGGAQWAPVAELLGVETPPIAPPPAPPPMVVAQARPGTSAGEPAMGWIVPTTADPLVIAGSYLALFGIVVPLLGPIALVLAIAAVRRRSRYPSAANMTRIVITMVLALLGTASTVFSVVGILAALRASGAI